MRAPVGWDLAWLLAISLATTLLAFAVGGIGVAAPLTRVTPAATAAAAPASSPAPLKALFELTRPAADSCVADPVIEVRGVAAARLGIVHLALQRGTTVLGSAEVVVDRAGPVAVTLHVSAPAFVGMVRLVVTSGRGPGGWFLASRSLGMCTALA